MRRGDVGGGAELVVTRLLGEVAARPIRGRADRRYPAGAAVGPVTADLLANRHNAGERLGGVVTHEELPDAARGNLDPRRLHIEGGGFLAHFGQDHQLGFGQFGLALCEFHQCVLCHRVLDSLISVSVKVGEMADARGYTGHPCYMLPARKI